MLDGLSYEDGKDDQATVGLAQYSVLDGHNIAYAVKTALQSVRKPDKFLQLHVVCTGRFCLTAPEACLLLRINYDCPRHVTKHLMKYVNNRDWKQWAEGKVLEELKETTFTTQMS